MATYHTNESIVGGASDDGADTERQQLADGQRASAGAVFRHHLPGEVGVDPAQGVEGESIASDDAGRPLAQPVGRVSSTHLTEKRR